MKKTLGIAIIVAIIALLGIRVIMGRKSISEASVAKASILGISVQDSADAGVLIVAVHANSLAEQKGLQPSDVILAVSGEPVKDQAHYQQVLDKALIANNAVFRIKRASGEVKVRFDLESAPVYNNLGNAYVKDRDYGQAINAYQKSLKLDPEFAEAYYNLGSVYVQQKKYNLAVENYNKAIELRKDFQAAYYKLAEAYDKQGKREDAIKIYKETVQTSPSDTVASFL
ncbi:tetratricopeptide repeat protein, partial [Candidatus Poribacteria bacterium]